MAATLTISTFTQFHTEVHAEENQLPTIEQFATVEELKTFDTNDQDEDGKNPAKVYFGNNDQQWWIAGSQDGNLTLFAASEQPFRVILPDEQIGYTLTVDKSEVEYGGSCTLTFALNEGYVKTGGFRIFSNNKVIYPNDDDKNKYTVKNIQNDINITVTGVNDNTSPIYELQ